MSHLTSEDNTKLTAILEKIQGKDVIDAVFYDKIITEEEAKLVIEHTKNPYDAYELVATIENNEDNIKWAIKIIEQTNSADAVAAAYDMLHFEGVSKEWYEKIEAKHAKV